MKTLRPCVTVLLAVSTVGCATVKPAADFARSRQLIQETTSVRGTFDPDAPPMTTADIEGVLADGLSLDEAVRLALVNSRRLQAEFMRIGVAKADWVQAGLLSNPSLEAAVMFPVGGGRSNIQASFAQNLLQALRIPVKKQIAQRQLDEAVLTIARRAGELAADTRGAYYDAVAADETLRVSRESLDVVNRSLEAIVRQRAAGMSNSLDENLGRGQALAADLATRNARLDAANARRKLAQLLSLDRDNTSLQLTDTLTVPPLALSSPDELIAAARQHRLDLQAAKATVDATAATLAFEKSRALPDINLGGSMERMERRGGDPAGIDVIAGPMLSLEIPIFDQNQAQVARAYYLHLQAVKIYEDLDLAIAQEVRGAIDHATTAQDNVAFYRDKLLPQAQEGFQLANDSFAAGRANLLMLLESQRVAIESRRSYIAVQRDAANARAQLQRSLGYVPQ